MRDEITGRKPRFVRLGEAVSYSPLSRSSLYKMAALNPGLFRKDGAATIVDLDLHDQIMASLPEGPAPEARQLRDRRAIKQPTT